QGGKSRCRRTATRQPRAGPGCAAGAAAGPGGGSRAAGRLRRGGAEARVAARAALSAGRPAAQVDIKVLVDERGRVVDSELLGAKAGFGFDEAALDAAKRAVFQPATKDGIRVKMWRTIRVSFKRPL